MANKSIDTATKHYTGGATRILSTLAGWFSRSSSKYTFISEKVNFTGDLIADDKIVIHGVMNGNIRSTHHVELGCTAHFEGNIESESATISGYVSGRIQTSKNIIVRVPATISGDLLSASVEVEAGVILHGRIISNMAQATSTEPIEKTMATLAEPIEQ